MMRASEAPIILAASTNSFSRSDSTCARTMRAGKNHPNTVKTTTSVTTPGARDAKGDVVEAFAGGRGERDDEQRCRKCHRHVDHARDDRVGRSAVVAGDGADDDLDRHDTDHREESDFERDAPAVEEAQELVAAERAIGAQDEQRLRPLRVGHVRPRPNGDESFVDGVEEELVRAVPEQLLSDVRTREVATTRKTMTKIDATANRSRRKRIQTCSQPRAFTSAGASVSTKTSVGTGSSCEAVVDTVNLRREELHLVR